PFPAFPSKSFLAPGPERYAIQAWTLPRIACLAHNHCQTASILGRKRVLVTRPRDPRVVYPEINGLEVSCQCLIVQCSDLGLARRDEWMPGNSELRMRSLSLQYSRDMSCCS